MKKLLLALMFFSLIFVTTSVLLAEEKSNTNLSAQAVPALYTNSGTGNQVEKILNPGEIKFFEQIKKMGNSLYGIRKNIENKQEQNKPQMSKASSTKTDLEKIANPSEIKFFEQIKKIGTALWGIRKQNAVKTIEQKPIFIKSLTVPCVKDAIIKKDASSSAVISLHAQNQITGINNRTACQTAALEKMSGQEQFEANKICINDFKTSVQSTNEMLNKSKNEIWNIYKNDLKQCSEMQKENTSSTLEIVSPEDNGEIMINDGNEEGPEVK